MWNKKSGSGRFFVGGSAPHERSCYKAGCRTGALFSCDFARLRFARFRCARFAPAVHPAFYPTSAQSPHSAS
jgi:hypothetical protein